MKIDQPHLEVLTTAIKQLLADRPSLPRSYHLLGEKHSRYRWDLYRFINATDKAIDSGDLRDEDIDAALRLILGTSF
jgi:hypothetical protein